MLPPEVNAMCRETWIHVARFRGDGTAPTPPLKPRSDPGREPYVDPWPYSGGAQAASCAVAVLLAGDDLDATRTGSEGPQPSISARWARAWLEVFDQLPGA